MGKCIVYTRIRRLVLIGPFISSCFSLSNFQTLQDFVTFFSGTVRLTNLKVGTHVDIGRCSMYTGIRLLSLIYPFISLFFFLSNFQTLKICLAFFSGTIRLTKFKPDTHVDNGLMYRVNWN